MSSNRLLHIFFGINLGNGHNGLSKIVGQRKLAAMKTGDCILFINRAQTALKMFSGTGDLLLHYKVPRHLGRLNPTTIRHLPNYVNGGTINYKGALKKALTEQLARRYT